MKKTVGILGAFFVTIGLLVFTAQKPTVAPLEQRQQQQLPPQPQKPRLPNISQKIPGHLDYVRIASQIQQWHQEAPDFTEIGTYGKSLKGVDLHYIRVTNKNNTAAKKKVLITACIHGNEPWSTSTVMAYIGNLLGEYGKNPDITTILDTRDIYFVPVLSPDSFPHSRHIEGVDPNRNFPGPSNPGKQSVTPIKAIMAFFNQHKFNAVISAHTHGRIFLTPFGDRNDFCPNHTDYERIIGKMATMCNYKKDRACNMYGVPIHGSELDWYYRGGAFSTLQNGKKIHQGAFAIVCEFGTHQNIPTMQDTKTEFDRTFKAFLYFCKEAPLVEIWWDEAGNPVNADGTPKRASLGFYTKRTIYRPKERGFFPLDSLLHSTLLFDIYHNNLTEDREDAKSGLDESYGRFARQCGKYVLRHQSHAPWRKMD